MPPHFLTLADKRLAYQRLAGKKGAPSLIFLGGLASDMTGTKAAFLAKKCQTHRYNFLRFDYSGHGQSTGQFTDGSIGLWLEDSLAMLDRLTKGPQILIGSSLGGWLALLLAIKRPHRVQAILGIAAAPDFTEDLIWCRLSKKNKHASNTRA